MRRAPDAMAEDLVDALAEERDALEPIGASELSRAFSDLEDRLAAVSDGPRAATRSHRTAGWRTVAYVMAGFVLGIAAERVAFHRDEERAGERRVSTTDRVAARGSSRAEEGAGVLRAGVEPEAPAAEADRENAAATSAKLAHENETREQVRRVPVRSAASSGSRLRDERQILDAARAALFAGALDDADRALSRHETSFPDGQLAEERESLRVHAIHQRGADVSAALSAFRARYPNSPFEPTLAALLRE